MIQPLHIERDRFLNPDGSEYRWKGHISFMAFKRSLNGFSLDDIIRVPYQSGSRCIVTLMMAEFIERFHPADYGPRFYAHIKPFAQALAKLDMYWMPIVGADQQVINLNFQDHLNKCAAEFDNEWNVFPSLCNEGSKNGIKPLDYSKPNTTNYWSRGSETGDSAPPRPYWDWTEWHPRRDWPKVLFGNDDGWYVKEGIDASNNQLGLAIPGIVSEPLGFWDRDIPGRRSQDPNLARVIGGTSIYFMRGANFHSEEGLTSSPWSPRTTECAVAFFNAINQI